MAGFYDNVTLTGLPSSKLDLPTFDTYIEKDGKLYQFKGWYKDNNYQEEFLDYVMPANGGIVYAKFEEVKQYDLTIVDGIGGFDKVLSVYEGLEFSLPSINELVLKDSKYYNFIGFYTDSNFENLLTSNIMPDNNLTIYLRYEEVLPIKVTLIDNGNNVVKEINVAYGTIIDSNYSDFMTPELYFDGRMHKFNGWLLNDNLFNDLKLIEDITLYASFTDLYTINYDDGFGNTITSYLEKGSYYELPSFTYELTDYKTYDLNEDIYNVNGNLVKLVGYNIGSYKPNEQVLVEGDLNITLNHKNVYELNVHEIVRRVQGIGGKAVAEHRNYVYLAEGEVDINNILGHKCSTSYSFKPEWIGYCTVTLTGDSVFYLNSNINIYYYEGTSHLV